MSERPMTLFFKANVEWIPQSKGGRKTIPGKGTRYCPIIDIVDDISWSIDFVCPDFSESSEIKFRFFVDEAPQEKVQIGEKYNLLEGNRVVAIAAIVSVESEAGTCLTVLMLPDICGNAPYLCQKPTDRYKTWYTEYLERYENPISHDNNEYMDYSGRQPVSRNARENRRVETAI